MLNKQLRLLKTTGIIFFLCMSICNIYGQAADDPQPVNRKGNMYIFWGWNRGWYGASDIHFKGTDFDFSLHHVAAHDQPSSALRKYINPFEVTIPQTDFRIGFFIKNNYALSFGFDHMKYVVTQHQVTTISGEISNTESVYDGSYLNDDITITRDFLQFEHTNGLNYINFDARRFDEVLNLNKIRISFTEGIGAGILLPKTDATLFDKNNNDEYHLSGYGISTVVAANISFFKVFFIQSELKNGFINMPDIRITPFRTDKASQHFLFTQFNVVLGANFRLHPHHERAK